MQSANKVKDYLKIMEDARAMMDSPVKRAFDYLKEEKPELVRPMNRKSPLTTCSTKPITMATGLATVCCWRGDWWRRARVTFRSNINTGRSRFRHAREWPRAHGRDETPGGPANSAVNSRLAERGLLERTLVMISTEFGGRLPLSLPPARSRKALPSGTRAKTRDREREDVWLPRPFQQRQQPVVLRRRVQTRICLWQNRRPPSDAADRKSGRLEDVHATVYKTLGIPADASYVTEGRPFYVTKDGKGVPIEGLLA